MAMQEFPVVKETTYHNTTKGLGRTSSGEPALMFITPLGEAHVFPMTEEERQELVKVLTGGIEVPSVKREVIRP